MQNVHIVPYFYNTPKHRKKVAHACGSLSPRTRDPNCNGCGLGRAHTRAYDAELAHTSIRAPLTLLLATAAPHIVGCITLRQKFVPLPVLTLVVCRGRAATAPAQYGSLPQGEMDDGKVRRCPAPKSPNAVGGVALRCVVPCGGPLSK